jgi:hypothetical protein
MAFQVGLATEAFRVTLTVVPWAAKRCNRVASEVNAVHFAKMTGPVATCPERGQLARGLVGRSASGNSTLVLLVIYGDVAGHGSSGSKPQVRMAWTRVRVRGLGQCSCFVVGVSGEVIAGEPI